MIIIPFIYFACWAFINYCKHGLNLGTFIWLIYTVASFFSIVLYHTDLEYANIEIGVLPTIVYVFLLTMVISPFNSIKMNDEEFNQVRESKVVDYIVYLYFVSFVFSFILFKDDLVFRIALGEDIGSLRGVDDAFTTTAQARLTGFWRIVSNVFGVLNTNSHIMLVIFFYTLAFCDKKWWYYLITLISSLGCIIMGIIGIDRSITFYYIVELLLAYILFRPIIPRGHFKYVYVPFGTIIFGLVAYFMMMTTSRFGEGEDALNSLLDYSGQSFINFCDFFDTYDAPQYNFSIFFPITSHYLFADEGAVSYGHQIELQTGRFVNVFYTFMGSFIIYVGRFFMVLYCCCLALIARHVINRPNRNLSYIIIVYLVASIPACGVISYIYTSYIRMLALILWLVICRCIYKFSMQIEQ